MAGLGTNSEARMAMDSLPNSRVDFQHQHKVKSSLPSPPPENHQLIISSRGSSMNPSPPLSECCCDVDNEEFFGEGSSSNQSGAQDQALLRLPSFDLSSFYPSPPSPSSHLNPSLPEGSSGPISSIITVDGSLDTFGILQPPTDIPDIDSCSSNLVPLSPPPSPPATLSTASLAPLNPEGDVLVDLTDEKEDGNTPPPQSRTSSDPGSARPNVHLPSILTSAPLDGSDNNQLLSPGCPEWSWMDSIPGQDFALLSEPELQPSGSRSRRGRKRRSSCLSYPEPPFPLNDSHLEGRPRVGYSHSHSSVANPMPSPESPGTPSMGLPMTTDNDNDLLGSVSPYSRSLSDQEEIQNMLFYPSTPSSSSSRPSSPSHHNSHSGPEEYEGLLGSESGRAGRSHQEAFWQPWQSFQDESTLSINPQSMSISLDSLDYPLYGSETSPLSSQSSSSLSNNSHHHAVDSSHGHSGSHRMPHAPPFTNDTLRHRREDDLMDVDEGPSLAYPSPQATFSSSLSSDFLIGDDFPTSILTFHDKPITPIHTSPTSYVSELPPLTDDSSFLSHSPSPSRRSFSDLPDLEPDDPPDIVPEDQPSLISLPGVDIDSTLLPSFSPIPIDSLAPYSPGLLIIDDANDMDMPPPRSPSPDDFELDTVKPDDSAYPEVKKLVLLRKKSIAAERAARQVEVHSVESGAVAQRVEARRVRKKEKERSREVGALLRIKLAEEARAGIETGARLSRPPSRGDGSSPRKLIGNMAQLVARMVFQRQDTSRPLGNRAPSSGHDYIRSSLSRSFVGDYNGADF